MESGWSVPMNRVGGEKRFGQVKIKNNFKKFFELLFLYLQTKL